MAGKKKPKKITRAQEKFIHCILNGKNNTDSYLEAYPSRSNWKRDSIRNIASKLWKEPHIQARYEHLLANYQAKEVAKTGWTREEAIRSLKFVVEKNLEEIERINQAYEDELEYMLKLIQQNPGRAEQITLDIMKKRKAKRVNMVNNQGVISAAAELNKMHGYNETNVNMNTQVVFEGEEELED